MKCFIHTAALCVVLGAAVSAQAAPVTATCKDGTAYSGAVRNGACSGHGGVKAFDDPAAKKVWVNSATKVYHCPADPAYGKTKAGSYMSEAAARAANNKPSGGKACP
jgi:hypothetical protein